MRTVPHFEPAHERAPEGRKAKRLEWITIAYLATVIIAMGWVSGASQAMKTAWIEDILSLVPPIAFLIAARIASWKPNEAYPYGYHRVTNIAFLFAAFALLAMGLFLIIDSVRTLWEGRHPTVGSIEIWGRTIWLGWLMIPVLIYSVVPVYFIGRAKIKVAKQLHDKCLYADAAMNKADWMTGLAALVGVLGISFGWWWVDAAAALVISLDITYDGYRNTREVIGDLMDRRPQTVEREVLDEVPANIIAAVQQLDWVQEADVRLREHGHLVIGEVFIVPTHSDFDVRDIDEARSLAKKCDWRIYDLVVQVEST